MWLLLIGYDMVWCMEVVCVVVEVGCLLKSEFVVLLVFNVDLLCFVYELVLEGVL